MKPIDYVKKQEYCPNCSGCILNDGRNQFECNILSITREYRNASEPCTLEDYHSCPLKEKHDKSL